jgi:hypothetical protein
VIRGFSGAKLLLIAIADGTDTGFSLASLKPAAESEQTRQRS